MTNVFIIHGAYGNPEENWFPWLKDELERLKCIVFVPKFPTPEDQILDNWMGVFDNYRKYVNENTIMIGHSVGATFILSLLEKLSKPIKAVVLVASFTGPLNLEIDKINKTFGERNFNWKKIKSMSTKFFIFHSDNDEYVPVEKAEFIAEKLDTKIIIVKNAGHFNKRAGYTKFVELLKVLKPIL